MTHEVVSITVETRDGRTFDITRVPPEDVITFLRETCKVQPSDILRTVHLVRGLALPRESL